MLINYIKYHCGNRRLFILYRPHDVDPVEVAKLYDISLDFGITQMTDSELNLHKEDYPLAFKSTRDNAYAYDLSGDAFIPSSNNFFTSVMLIKPKGEDFGFTAVHFKVIDSSIVRTSSEVVKFFFEFIKRRSIPLLLANIHPVFENPIAFVKECLATLERDQSSAYQVIAYTVRFELQGVFYNPTLYQEAGIVKPETAYIIQDIHSKSAHSKVPYDSPILPHHLLSIILS